MAMWFYEIRGNNNRVVERSSPKYFSEGEAHFEGGERAKKLMSSVGAPGGSEVLSVMVGQDPGFMTPDPASVK